MKVAGRASRLTRVQDRWGQRGAWRRCPSTSYHTYSHKCISLAITGVCIASRPALHTGLCARTHIPHRLNIHSVHRCTVRHCGALCPHTQSRTTACGKRHGQSHARTRSGSKDPPSPRPVAIQTAIRQQSASRRAALSESGRLSSTLSSESGAFRRRRAVGSGGQECGWRERGGWQPVQEQMRRYRRVRRRSPQRAGHWARIGAPPVPALSVGGGEAWRSQSHGRGVAGEARGGRRGAHGAREFGSRPRKLTPDQTLRSGLPAFTSGDETDALFRLAVESAVDLRSMSGERRGSASL
eukprot:2763538-Prymnesium_polylepis.2